MKRTLIVKNWKQYNDAEFDINSDMICFIGKNGSGKSSMIQSLETILQVKGFVKEPINKNGAKDASIKYVGIDNEGNPITISCIIEKNDVDKGDITYNFSAAAIINNKPKTITDVKKIRELIGNYYPLTVEEVLNMVKFAEGRRSFIDNYLHQLIKPEMRMTLQAKQFAISSAKNKNTEGNFYHTRTQLNKEIEALNIEINASKLSEEDVKELGLKKGVKDLLEKLNKEYEEHKEDPDKITGVINTTDTINTHWQNYKIAYEGLRDVIGNNDDCYNDMEKRVSDALYQLSTEKGILYPLDKLNALKDRIMNGKIKLANIHSLEKKQEPVEKIAERDKKMAEWNKMNESIEQAKLDIKQIYVDSKFPAGLEIDEDRIMLNGFELNETTNSNTEARMAILDLLCNISTSEYVQVGDWSLFDTESRKKVLELAKKHKRIFIGQLVSDDMETSLKTLIID